MADAAQRRRRGQSRLRAGGPPAARQAAHRDRRGDVRLRRRRLAVLCRPRERAVRRAHHPDRTPPHPLHAAGCGRGRAADLRRVIARPGPHGHARRLLRAVRGGRIRHARLRPRRRRARMARVVAEGRVGDSPLGPRMGVRWWRLATGVLLGLGMRGEVVGHLLGRGVRRPLGDLGPHRPPPRRASPSRGRARCSETCCRPRGRSRSCRWRSISRTGAFWFASETATDRYASTNAFSSMLTRGGKVLAFHQGLTTQSAGAHPWESKPWSWPMGLRPMLYYYAGDGGHGLRRRPSASAP